MQDTSDKIVKCKQDDKVQYFLQDGGFEGVPFLQGERGFGHSKTRESIRWIAYMD
jgi:hypothetical protein